MTPLTPSTDAPRPLPEHEPADTMRAYFAYGLNMDVRAMAMRCPGARLIGVASVDNHDFVINRHGLATVIVRPRRRVHGLLWRIAPEDEATLDVFEAVADGLYHKAVIGVRAPKAPQPSPTSALVYLASEARPGRPQPGYLEAVVSAARAHALPPAYLDRLRRWAMDTNDR